MNWDVLLDGASITDKVASFEIIKDERNFCKELSIILNDYELYASFDFTEIPAEPRIEIKTEIDGIWISEGLFFIEKPTVSQNKDSIVIQPLWGRDISAKLSNPFATRISKEWDEDTTLFAILQEIIEEADLEYDADCILINDYTVYALSYSSSLAYPIDILQDLVGKTDGYVQTDREGRFWILKNEYHWSEPSTTIGADQIQTITENVEYPVFCNRIKVSAYARTDEADCSLALELDDSSIAIGETTLARAVVTHLDGSPVADGYAVDWTTDVTAYAHWLHVQTHVYTHRITAEAQYATSRYLVSTTYPIRQVHSVIEVATGLPRAVKEFKGRSITLDEPLTFTDSGVLIDYETAYAENTLVAGAVGEVEVDVHALVETYVRDTQTIRIDTESGSSSEDQDKLVTVEYIDYHTEEVLPDVEFTWDGVSYMTGEDGQKDIGLQAGGEHAVVATKDGYKPSNLPDGLVNDSVYVK